MWSKVLSFSCRIALVVSYEVRIEARDPLAKEKAITPTSIMNEQKTISMGFMISMSPYPTVVIVVTVQYIETIYNYDGVIFSSIYFSIQVPVIFASVAYKVGRIIQKHAIICINIKLIKQKNASLSNPLSIYIKLFLFDFINFSSLRSLVNLISFESLPILANLIRLFSEEDERIISKGIIATASMINHPLIYVNAIFQRFLSMDKSSSIKAVLNETIISIKNSASCV